MPDRTSAPPLRPKRPQSERVRPRLAISLGDPNGIGPEVALKALADSRIRSFFRPLLVGARSVVDTHAATIEWDGMELVTIGPHQIADERDDNVIPVLDLGAGDEVPVEFGRLTRTGGTQSMQAVEVAVDLCREGLVDGMVTAPINKEAIWLGGYRTPGHTEFIAQRVGADQHLMMMVADELRVGLVTGHVPLADVPAGITQKSVLQRLRIIDEGLRTDFAVDRPRIAVLGLNPHAGDGGVLGREEIDHILPAIKGALDEGILAFGPFPCDGFFATGDYKHYDGVLAMYHDQGLAPFKALTFEGGVNCTIGLPIVRTSPDHGTAYAIAGQNKARPGSMRAALFLAAKIARRRKRKGEAGLDVA